VRVGAADFVAGRVFDHGLGGDGVIGGEVGGEGEAIGIGAAVARRPLPHHRAYGSVHGGSSRLR
jgi:hypothetical protein